MKSKVFFKITAISALGMAILLVAGSAFASESNSDSDTADLRPVWLADHAVYSQDSALLYSDQNPSFAAPSLEQQMLSSSGVQSVEQQYENRSRDYEMRQSYGIATQTDESSYISDVSGMGKSMFTAARTAPVRQYQQNFEQSEQGDNVSQPVQAVGGAVALGSGTQVPFELGDQAKGTWSGDLMNEHGELNVKSQVMNAHVEMNLKNAAQDPTQPLDPTVAVERYKVSVNRELGFKVMSSVTYGSTSSSVLASLSRPIFSNIQGSVGTTQPVGNDLSGAPAEVRGGLSYGITF